MNKEIKIEKVSYGQPEIVTDNNNFIVGWCVWGMGGAGVWVLSACQQIIWRTIRSMMIET